MDSIGEATQNAYVDIEGIDLVDGALTFHGLPITSMETIWDGCLCTILVKPTSSMILFVGWLMAALPERASVVWRDGWPFVYCPPNDDCDFEDDPTPSAPDELELV